MEAELKQLLKDLLTKTFSGQSSYYPKESEVAYLRLEYAPGKLIHRLKGPMHPAETKTELLFTEDLETLESWKEFIGDKLHKTYSREEVRSMAEMGILNRFLHEDPRQVLKMANKVEKLPNGNFLLRIWSGELLWKKVEIWQEFFIENGMLKKMATRKFMSGKATTAGGAFEIEFEYK